MWNPVKIDIENLFAHKKSEYCFKNNVCTVIFGKNETDRGAENNGAGKTTLFEAISIALTNESLRAIKKDAFINREEDDCKITFELVNEVLKKKLKIVRQFFRGNKPVKVEVWENDELNSDITSVNEANKRVMELIGIGREDLLRYFIISQDNNYTFFTASDGDKKEVMNRITSADMINPALDELDCRLKEKEARYRVVNNEVGVLSSNWDLLEEQEREVIENDDRDEKIKSLTEEIENRRKLYFELIKDIGDAKFEVEAYQDEMENLEGGDLEFFNDEITAIKKEMRISENEIHDNKVLKRRVEVELQGAVTCPDCGKVFISSEEHVSIDDLEELLKESENNINRQEKVMRGLEKELYDWEKGRKECYRKVRHQEELELQINTTNRKIGRWEDDLKVIKRKELNAVEELNKIKHSKAANKLLQSILNKKKEIEASKNSLEKELLALNGEIEIIRYWVYYMGRSGFATYLANKSIKIIEGITNSYLKKFGTDLSVLVNGFTILKSGEVREKIDIFVQSDGVTAESYLSKSGGERGRINLAGILGIQHLINLSTDGKGLNLLCFDECFAGIDSKGQENIIKILEKMGITILMITQNVSDSFNNENTLYVVKNKDVSRYI